MSQSEDAILKVAGPLLSIAWATYIFPALQAEVAKAGSPDLKLLEPPVLAALNSFVVAECARFAALP